MTEKPRFTIRPFSRPSRSDHRDAFRVCFSASALILLKLKAGELCQIISEDGTRHTAIAWTAAEKIQETVVQTSKTLQETYGLKLGDKVDIAPYNGPTPDAAVIYLQPHKAGSGGDMELEEKDKSHWEWFLDMPISRAEHVTRGMVFESELKGRKIWFNVINIDGKGNGDSTLFRYCEESSIRIASPEEQPDAQTISGRQPFILETKSIGGLDRQIKQINRVIRKFGSTSKIKLPEYYRPSQGLLLYGPKGTGKSLLIDCISKCAWKKVCYVGFNGTREAISTTVQKAFEDAKKNQPSLVVLNQVDSLAPKRSSYDFQSSSSIASSLRGGFEVIRGSSVLVVAETRHPNEIDETLRAPTRFGLEIEVSVPTANDRLEILKAIRAESVEPGDDLLFNLSERTHGYTGADLITVTNLAIEFAEDRVVSQLGEKDQALGMDRSPNAADTNGEVSESSDVEAEIISLHIEEVDLSQALAVIRPTALQEIFLSTPHTPWSSIGGYSNIKQHLRTTVSRPLRYPEQMASFNLRPRKGLLLYGPPGCSKTLLVKALATESGLNFMAVKGAELLSMYVGESERAVREVFRKARAASPSIIFFDEVDAIASARGSAGGGSSGINVLTTLLNEIDGIEELKNVLVVAATNTPQTIDPALLRPGRLDHLLYVGLPDYDARREILTKWFANSQVTDELKDSAVIDKVSESLGGYSGAEIVGICETAGNYAMDRLEELQLEDGSSTDSTNTVKINLRDMELAISRVRKGVTPDTIRAFDEWAKGRD